MTDQPVHVVLTLPEKMRKTRDRIAAIRAELAAELERRDEQIVEAYDERMSVRAIGRDAGVAHTRVLAIVATRPNVTEDL